MSTNVHRLKPFRCCRHALEDGPKYVEPDQGDPYAGDDRGAHMS
jgi:hypothetical protein